MSSLRLVVLTLGLLICLAQNAFGVSLAERLDALVKQHERIKATQEKAEAARQGVNQAMGGLLPQLEATASASRQEINPARDNSDATVMIRNEQNVKATQLLFDFGATWYTMEQAESEHERAKTELDHVTQQMIFEGAEAYLNAIRAYEKVKYARQSEASIKRQTGMEETLVERGAGLSSDVLQAKQQLAGARALRVVAEGELMNAQSRFLAVFREMPTDEMVAEFQLPPLPFDLLPETLEEAVSSALDGNKELLMAQSDVHSAENIMKQTRADFFPTLNLFGEVNRRENDLGITGQRLENRTGVEMNWNLFSGGADLAEMRAARSRINQARFVHGDLKRTIDERVRVAWENLLTYRVNAKFLKDQADILAEFLDLAKKERTMGNRSLLDVLSAEVDYINAQSNAVTAEFDTLIAAYQLLLSTGKLNLGVFSN